MLKWVELATTSESSRYQFLSRFLKENGIENSFEFIACDESNILQNIENSKSNFDQIIIDMKFGEILRNNLVELSTKHYFSPTSDCLLKTDGTWLPRSYLEEAFIESLNKKNMRFDIQANALIIGCNTLARIAINGFLKVGYTKILICDKNKESVESFIKDYSLRSFNVNFKFVSQDELAYLPGSSSLLINTTSTDPSNDLMNDLYYFNYLNKDGVVIDLNLYPLVSPLLTQAKDLGIQIIEGPHFYAVRDFKWLKAISKVDLKWDSFSEAWLNSIKS